VRGRSELKSGAGVGDDFSCSSGPNLLAGGIGWKSLSTLHPSSTSHHCPLLNAGSAGSVPPLTETETAAGLRCGFGSILLFICENQRPVYIWARRLLNMH